MKNQFASVLNMGPISQVVGMIPGFNANMIPKGQEKESTDRIKKFLSMMDSMTKDELDCVKPLTESRILRIARGAGANPKELVFLLGEHKKFSKMVEKFGKMNMDDNMDNVSFQSLILGFSSREIHVRQCSSCNLQSTPTCSSNWEVWVTSWRWSKAFKKAGPKAEETP